MVLLQSLPAAYLFGLKHPFRDTVLIHPIPPTETNEEATRDVLHRPKIQGTQHHYDDKAGHEAIAKPAAEHISQERSNSEEEVKEYGPRVPRWW